LTASLPEIFRAIASICFILASKNIFSKEEKKKERQSKEKGKIMRKRTEALP